MDDEVELVDNDIQLESDHGDENISVHEKSLGLYFEDGVRKIDFIIAFKSEEDDDNEKQQQNMRNVYFKNLKEKGVEIEEEFSSVSFFYPFLKHRCQ